MITTVLDKINNPFQSLPLIKKEKTQKNGRTLVLLTHEKTYTDCERVSLFFKSLGLTLCTLGFVLISANRRRKWKVVFTGKEIKQCQYEKPIKVKSDEEKARDKVLSEAPKFVGYRIKLPDDHPGTGLVLTLVSIRPANLFLESLFKDTGITTTLPGDDLFRFEKPNAEVKNILESLFQKDPKGTITFSAKGKSGVLYGNEKPIEVEDLAEIYGDHSYEISYKEIQETLDSQYIFTYLPLPFYRALKKAMLEDEIVIIPFGYRKLSELKPKLEEFPHLDKFLDEVQKDFKAFGFASEDELKKIFDFNLYQIGAMVVKTEDFRIFVDGDGKIFNRKADQKDAIKLINACGIREIRSSNTAPKLNAEIMFKTFKTSLIAAEEGIVIFPAVGMGVWKGDPDLYWRAFLDAVIASEDNFDAIYVNPGHQKTPDGIYQRHNGNEFQIILDEYLEANKGDKQLKKKLKKIHNLYDTKQDVVQLAHNLKKSFPNKTVSLFNASDPDVTLGYHVGEYVNHMCHTVTTEENYTAMGTNGICFEEITGVLEDNDRVIQT